jgi:hypothetical protein
VNKHRDVQTYILQMASGKHEHNLHMKVNHVNINKKMLLTIRLKNDFRISILVTNIRDIDKNIKRGYRDKVIKTIN